jgi:hypothetical protein
METIGTPTNHRLAVSANKEYLVSPPPLNSPTTNRTFRKRMGTMSVIRLSRLLVVALVESSSLYSESIGFLAIRIRTDVPRPMKKVSLMILRA